MNFLNAFKNKDICIPLLQRDYVQGGKESVISSFIDSLLDESKPSDLNYIYGYTKDGSFIPVDGQQRLTTLWLLYLYAAAKAGMMSEFTVNLTFLSREYAGDFCERLKCKMPEVLKKATENDRLNSIIQDEYWFLTSWLNNATVKNMLLTLKYIHHKCAGQEAEALWKHLSSEDGITFAFLDMSDKNENGLDDGLDDDIYIKMNGRGRPLSVFENLKSWMDEKVMQAMKDSDELWLHKWIKNMDNSWTQFFWENRNLTQDHPEEIDDEQLFCFCNLIILYWMRNKEQLQDHISEMKTTDYYLYEQLLTLFHQSNETDEPSDIVGYLFDKLQKGDLPSLVWIERLKLLPPEFLKFAHDSLNKLNKLSRIYKSVNDLDLFMGKRDTNVKTIYDLALSESSYSRSLPLLYAVLLNTKGIVDEAWMRECRNLILNTDIYKENLPEILNCLKDFSEQAKDSDVYTILQSYNEQKNDFLHYFKRSQIEEECKKASMPPKYFPQMEKMENSRFFSGRISSVFRILEHKDGIENYTLQDFIDCSNILMEIFYTDGNNGGVRSIYDDQKDRLLRRALMTFPPYSYGMYRSGNWCFCDNTEEWRDFLNNEDSEIDSLRQLIVKSCLPALRHSSCTDISESILQSMREAIDNANRDYEEKLEKQDGVDKFNLHFIHHVGIWDYMGASRCCWEDKQGFNIFLKTSKGNNSGKMELRTYTLYLDYCDTSIRKDLLDDRNGWNVDIYPREDSCVFFQTDVPQNNRVVAIDVSHGRSKEDDYVLKIFLRPTNEEENNQKLYIENNKTFFKQFLELNNYISVQMEESGRYKTENTFSRKGIQMLLHQLLPSLKEYITEHYGTESH